MHQWSIFKIFLLYVTGFVNPAASGFSNNFICFVKNSSSVTLCNTTLSLCDTGVVTQISTDIKYSNNPARTQCTSPCTIPRTATANRSDILNHCYGTKVCTVNSTKISEIKGGALVFNVTCGASTSTSSLSMTSSRSPSTDPPTSDSGLSTSSQATNPSSTVSNANNSGLNASSTGPDASSTASDADSTTAASSDDPFPTAIVVSVVVSVIIVVLVVVAFLMYRKGQCKQLLGKCTKGHRKHSPDRSDELVMGSMANANLTYDLSSVVDVNNYNEDYSEIDKVDKENYFEYSQVNLKRKQPVHSLTDNHIRHFDRSSEDAEHTYNHVGDETSQKSDWSTLQPDTYSHVGAMARPASGHLDEDSYAHINGVVKDLPAAYETNQYDCAVFQFNGGQTGNSGHPGSEIKSGKENNFIEVGPSKVDMSSDAPVSHSYFLLEKHEKEA